MKLPCPNCHDDLIVTDIPGNRICYCCTCGYESREARPRELAPILSLRDRQASVSLLREKKAAAKNPLHKAKKMKKTTDRGDYVSRRSSR